MAVTPKTRREYKGNASSTTINGAFNAGATTVSITANTGWPTTGPFYAVIDPGTASEEKIYVGSISSSNLSSITRGVDGTTDVNHSSGAVIYPVFTAIDADEANQLTSTYQNKGGIVYMGDPSFTQLAVGTSGQVLKVSSGLVPEWGQVGNAGIASEIAGNGLAGGNGTALSVNVDGTGIEINSDTLRLKDSGVTTAKIADDAVTAAKIADDAVTAAKIGVLTNTTAKTDNYTLAFGDENTTILMDKATEIKVIIPTNATTAFAVGTQISFVQIGAGQLVFEGASGVTLNSDNSKKKVLVRYGVASLIKTATDTWVLFGQLTA